MPLLSLAFLALLDASFYNRKGYGKSIYPERKWLGAGAASSEDNFILIDAYVWN